MIAGVPYAPVSAPYSLVAKDFAKLKAIVALLTPGLVFVDDGVPFAAALESGRAAGRRDRRGSEPAPDARAMTLESILATTATPEVDRAQAKVGPDTIAKLLFTSGSTGTPKGVINTHRMMTSNQAMLRGVNPSYAAEPPVLIDWLPWSHTFGGNNNFNLVLANGGTSLHRRGPAAAGRDRSHGPELERNLADGLLQRAPGFRDAVAISPGGPGAEAEPVRAAAGVLLRRRALSLPMSARATSGSGSRRLAKSSPW